MSAAPATTRAVMVGSLGDVSARHVPAPAGPPGGLIPPIWPALTAAIDWTQ